MCALHVTIVGNAQEAFRDTIGIKGVDLALWSLDRDGLCVEAATRWGITQHVFAPRFAGKIAFDSVEVSGKKMSGNDGTKTLIGVLAGHDSVRKNNDLIRLLHDLHDDSKDRALLRKFHFVFTKGTFRRVVLGERAEGTYGSDELQHMRQKVREFMLRECGITVLPGWEQAGVTVLANMVVERQCSILWPFLSPVTTHWLSPEYNALMRLSDLWNVKRLMNVESVKDWFHNEAARDVKRNPQKASDSPLKIRLGSVERDGLWPVALRHNDNAYDSVDIPVQMRKSGFYTRFSDQTIALIAHDEMKQRMVDFSLEYEDELCAFKRVLTTGHTGEEVESACRRLRAKGTIRRFLTGPKGGDIEIATEIIFNRCHVVVFFVDPLHPHAHIDDVRVVFGVCMAEIEGNDVRLLTNEFHAREWMENAVRRRR
ncbi:MAG: hypothetical protein ACXV5E_04355 [Halobacteriota archaeon]